jgi:MOSC domain-containing protein YiiM
VIETHPSIELVRVAVGLPAIIGQNRDGDVLSGIAKREVDIPEVIVRTTNIDGDGQADLRNHGGVDKAVYCYPREHRAWWGDEIGYDREEAPFGENLSVTGIEEDEAHIGDVWQWGTAVLQISQPRWPCYKLAMHSGHRDMVKRFVESGRSGWYLRVLEEGVAPTSGEIQIIQRDPLGVTVMEAMLARRRKLGADETARIFAHPALATAWKG